MKNVTAKLPLSITVPTTRRKDAIHSPSSSSSPSSTGSPPALFGSSSGSPPPSPSASGASVVASISHHHQHQHHHSIAITASSSHEKIEKVPTNKAWNYMKDLVRSHSTRFSPHFSLLAFIPFNLLRAEFRVRESSDREDRDTVASVVHQQCSDDVLEQIRDGHVGREPRVVVYVAARLHRLLWWPHRVHIQALHAFIGNIYHNNNHFSSSNSGIHNNNIANDDGCILFFIFIVCK